MATRRDPTLQRTLARSTEAVVGLRLNEERPAALRIHPAAVDSGICFVRADLPQQPEVSCAPAHIVAEGRWSALEQAGVQVHLTEHLLATLQGLGVDNARVEVDGSHLPIVGGGSCEPFVRALRQAGLVEQDRPRQVFGLRAAQYQQAALDIPGPASQGAPSHGRSSRWLMAQPADTLAVTYVLHVPVLTGLRMGLSEVDLAHEPFTDRLAGARTYFLKPEASQLATQLSSAQRDFIVLDNDSPQALVDEVARHKSVDLLGDLLLLGRPLRARIVAFRTGHRFHHDWVRALHATDQLVLMDDPLPFPHPSPGPGTCP